MSDSLQGNEELVLEVSIEEMQRSLKSQFEGIDAIKSTARTVFGASSLIVSLLAALQLAIPRIIPNLLAAYQIGVVLALILYAFQVTICIYVLLPISVSGPVQADWDVLYNAFSGDSKVEVMRMRLSAYLNAIELNEPKIQELKKITTVASVILPIIVVILLILSLFPRVASPGL